MKLGFMGIFSFGKKRTDASEREGQRGDGRGNSRVSGRDTGRSARASERRERTMAAAGGADRAPAAARVRRGAPGQETMLDPTLPEKQRARRRLVGAIALVLAAVVILPMVLDSHPKPVTNDIAISIPDQDGGRARARGTDASVRSAANNPAMLAMDSNDSESVKNAANTMNATDAAAPDSPPASLKANTQASQAGQGTIGTAANSATSNAAAPGRLAAGGPAKTTAKVATATTAATASTASTGTGKSETNYPRPQPAPSGSASDASLPPTPATPGSRYVVQLGAFNSDAAAREWVSKLKNIGVPAYTDHVKQANGVTQVMLRAGPFADRTVAQAAVLKVRRAGLSEAGH